MDRIYQGEEALCIHNAATGRELIFPNIITSSKIKKKIVIVGAGPGGLEAARIAGERGHNVVVLKQHQILEDKLDCVQNLKQEKI